MTLVRPWRTPVVVLEQLEDPGNTLGDPGGALEDHR